MFKAVRHYWRQPEHFYWLTSFLAAREAQTATCRLIAAVVATLGVVPLMMQWSAAGPQTPGARLIGAWVTVSSLLLALGWLRPRWPTPRQSIGFVVLTSANIAAGCLIMSDPRAGLVLTAGFAVLGGYIALFHTAGYLLFALLVAEATTLALTAQLWTAGDGVFAVTALVIVMAVNIAVPFACHLLLYAFDINVDNADIDPLTGLLNRAAIYRAASAMVARCRDDDQRLVLVLLRLDNMRLLGATDGAVAIQRARVAIAQTLRETTRHNAFVARLEDDDFLIADTFSTPDSFPLVERVRKAIAATPPRVTASFGVVSTPMRGLGSCPPDELLDELIASASTAMDTAREAGGNQARYITCDRPSVLGTVDPRSVEDL
jgi:diguanylate cyclase (GGDEF)-like protein